MATKVQSRVVLFLLLVFISGAPLSFCQSNSPQNIQTFYPFPVPPIIWTPSSPNNESNSPSTPPEPPPPQPQPQPQPQPAKSSSKEAVTKAVLATAASALVLSAVVFFLLQRYSSGKKQKDNEFNPYRYPFRSDPAVPPNEFARFNGNLKGLIVDEDGLDVLYWRSLEGEDVKNNFSKEAFEKEERRKKKSELPIQEIPLLRGKSSTSHLPQVEDGNPVRAPPPPAADEKQGSSIQLTTHSLPPPLPPKPAKKGPAPPPPPPIPAKKGPAPPPPPPIPAKKGPAPPPPPPSLATSHKPPPPNGAPRQGESSSGQGTTGDENGQVKLKPLHWDKVNPNNVDHSMVWHKIDDGSFRFDDELMEALFGSVATNRKSPTRGNTNSLSRNDERSTSQIFILDTRKSQNTAIVLRSLAISRTEIIDALTEGNGLNTDALEKLTKIAPSKEEETEILAFEGDPTRLADAESFLFHLLKAIPSAFTRFDAMLFRSNYDSEITHFRESLQALELACKELRTRGLFLKLLEAILKAGNRMNAGTSRGNAQAFNLTALRKLSDVKSIDGKTTLLHFVVEEVVRAEGKRCVVNRNRSMSRSSSRSSQSSENSTLEEDKEREYMKLGLPVVGGLSVEFSNVKKAATMDYDSFAKTCPALAAQIAETRQLLKQCDCVGGGFFREMKSFLEVAEGEIKAVKEEQMRVMELVNRTTEYYQAGASKDKEKHSLQLFVIVTDFLGMVDKVCIEIARNLQKRRVSTNAGSSSPNSLATRSPVRFPTLPENFMSEKSKSSSSDSDDEF